MQRWLLVSTAYKLPPEENYRRRRVKEHDRNNTRIAESYHYYIDLIVDFNNKEVSGVVYNDWEISYLAAEIKGSIDLFRYSIEADCDGYFINKETDASEEVHMKINGYLSENLNNFSGSLAVEGFGTKPSTAQK